MSQTGNGFLSGLPFEGQGVFHRIGQASPETFCFMIETSGLRAVLDLGFRLLDKTEISQGH